ncbi:HPP family protein [Catalinimonas alkaloidigena]|uniref:HPP family protein n=1 Tax=Catalinimonas alkaloidigena TaxID=1075417 RepID=A0A1G9UVA5_9BACT|nr:HPP family protein [Catalinimonas alkaloidigena]SDM63786.1 HPP family protein [Catalinimonas alkaloidigena]
MKQRKAFRKARYIVYRQTILDPWDHLWTFLGALIGIGLIGLLQHYFLSQTENLFLIGSFGASAVLIYGATNSPLAQPRNLVGGHLISALLGVTVAWLFQSMELAWLACALAVALSIVAMQITKTMHPPGGATALIANLGSEKIASLGFGYVLMPVLSGVVILLGVALVCNNLPKNRRYPYRPPKRS